MSDNATPGLMPARVANVVAGQISLTRSRSVRQADNFDRPAMLSLAFIPAHTARYINPSNYKRHVRDAALHQRC